MVLNEIERILPWQKLDAKLEDLKAVKGVIIELGVIERPEKDFETKLGEAPLDYEIVNFEENKVYLIISYLEKDREPIRETLVKLGFEPVSFENLKGRPSEILKNLQDKFKTCEAKLKEIDKKLKELSSYLDEIYILAEHYYNLLQRSEVESCSLHTEKVFLITGWVIAQDYKKLLRIIEKFESVSIEQIEPEPGETPPVALMNKGAVRQYELLTKIYSVPKPGELDPTLLLTIFFTVFFGFCLGDAAYGIVMCILSLLFMRRIKGGKELLWILFACGLSSIVVGAITGSWFDGLLEKFIPNFVERLKLFDPLKNVTLLLLIALILGISQMIVGYIMGMVQAIRDGKLLEAIGNKLSWIIVILTLIGMMVLPKLGINITKPALITIGAMIILILIAGSAYAEGNFVIKLIQGGINLLMGFIGILGDSISYLRLAALGLVTMGMAMSVNILVDLFSKLPIVGILIGILLFVFGHFLSLFLNVMGSFVHSLRLQYAEFFSKFYEGGGEPFIPFGYAHKYIVIEG